MSEKLVTVARFVNVAEAEAARIALAAAGIRARLSNAALVSWFWHYSNATGGVGLLVRQTDSETARNVLREAAGGPFQPDPSQTCSTCSEPLFDGWENCWRCGSDRAGHADRPAEEDTPAEPNGFDAADRVELLGVAALMTGILFAYLPELPVYRPEAVVYLPELLLAVSFVWICQLVLSLHVGTREAAAISEEQEPSDTLPSRREMTAEDVAARAWRAAVFGAIWFPPLIYYSMYVLRRLTRSRLPITRRARKRRLAAWWTNLLFVIPRTVAIAMVIIALMYGFGHFVVELAFFVRDLFVVPDRPW
jgi:hypothetical protein